MAGGARDTRLADRATRRAGASSRVTHRSPCPNPGPDPTPMDPLPDFAEPPSSIDGYNCSQPGGCHRLTGAMNAIGTIWILVLMVLINSDVIGRDLFGAPVRGVTEIVSMSIVGSVFSRPHPPACARAAGSLPPGRRGAAGGDFLGQLGALDRGVPYRRIRRRGGRLPGSDVAGPDDHRRRLGVHRAVLPVPRLGRIPGG